MIWNCGKKLGIAPDDFVIGKNRAAVQAQGPRRFVRRRA